MGEINYKFLVAFSELNSPTDDEIITKCSLSGSFLSNVHISLKERLIGNWPKTNKDINVLSHCIHTRN